MSYFTKIFNKPLYSRYLKISVFFTLFGIPNLLWAADDDVGYSLTLAPKQCVSMRQGQRCYVDIELSWRSAKQGNYCVFSSQQHKPLRCWNSLQQGSLVKEVSAKENVIFTLKKAKNTKILASEKLEMAWVYKKNIRANSWRMF